MTGNARVPGVENNTHNQGITSLPRRVLKLRVGRNYRDFELFFFSKGV